MLRKLNPQLTWLLQNWAFHELRKTGLEYPARSPITRFGEGSNVIDIRTRVPRYEPDSASQRVSHAMQEISHQAKNLLYAKYIEGMSERAIGLICGCTRKKVRWDTEKAYQEIAEEMKINTYSRS